MKAEPVQHWIEDFSKFCINVDVRDVIAAADEEGNAPGQSKQLYALAIVRALHEGDLGSDYDESLSAVCMLWERGHVSGFNTDSFNRGLKEWQKAQRRSTPGIFTKPVNLFSKAVGR
jgi:hypothetical protein